METRRDLSGGGAHRLHSPWVAGYDTPWKNSNLKIFWLWGGGRAEKGEWRISLFCKMDGVLHFILILSLFIAIINVNANITETSLWTEIAIIANPGEKWINSHSRFQAWTSFTVHPWFLPLFFRPDLFIEEESKTDSENCLVFLNKETELLVYHYIVIISV